jgi:murein DD-endopeptidase MepM/ murein hydrolase activator NlpD
MEKPERQGLSPHRRDLLCLAAAGAALAALPAWAQTAADPLSGEDVHREPFGLKGRFVQSGYAIGQTRPGGILWVDGIQRGPVGDDGTFFIGFDRDAPANSTIEIHRGDDQVEKAMIPVAATTYDIQRVDGLPQDTVTPADPALLARIKREAALKAEAFTSRLDAEYFRGGFQWPLDHFIVSGHFGNQRVLNGTPASPHMGFDMAAPTGTPIHAPQKGLVVLSETDLFYEGGLLLVDHGQGLISMYLHQSRVIARKGDVVEAGQVIGEVGAKGRATGPHLCWRLKWTDRHMDPSLMVPRST